MARTLLTLLALLCALPSAARAMPPGVLMVGVGTARGGDGVASGEGAQDYYIGTTWDLDATETEFNSLLSGVEAGIGTTTRIVEPTLPQGTLTPVVASDTTEFEAASGGAAQAITLDADINDDVRIWGDDIRVNLAGFHVDEISLGRFSVGVPARVHIVGPGTLGKVYAITTGFGAATDILIDGVFISTDFLSTPAQGVAIETHAGFDSVERFGVVNSIIRGYSGVAAITCGTLMRGIDIAFVNVNIGAGLSANGNQDDWGSRFAEGTVNAWIVDSMIRSQVKPPVRTGGPEPGVNGRIIYTTAAQRATSRRTSLVNLHNGNMAAAIAASSAVNNRYHIELFTSWYAAEGGGAATQLWGPSTAAGHNDYMWLSGGLDVTCTDDGIYSAAIFTSREGNAEVGETWDLDVLAGTANTFTHEAVAQPTWPTVTGGASAGTSFVVGDDPYEDP